MNEVTKIHLGRQAFNIAIDAHTVLRKYLEDITRYVHDEGVVSEIELRMAELLNEHGVRGEQVILPADVQYLKDQLGDPKDFADEDEPEVTVAKPADGKRLYRDTDNAMLAGVAAGIANYFSVDALLIRLIFIILTFAGGWGILIYLVLWVLVPEAKSPSDRLRMAGKPVTIEGLREIVDRADVKGAARRANESLAGPINTAFQLILKLIGVCFVIVGIAILLALTGSAIYVLLHIGDTAQLTVFPVGLKEHLLIYLAAAVIGLLALFIVLFGMAIYRRAWPIRAWITGTLIGLICISIVTGGALAADVVPQVRDRYNANVHVTDRPLLAFKQVNANSLDGSINVFYQPARTYSVSIRYFDHPDLSNIHTSITGGTLMISSPGYNANRNCQFVCLPDGYNMSITVNAPVSPNFTGYDNPPPAPNPPNPPSPLKL